MGVLDVKQHLRKIKQNLIHPTLIGLQRDESILWATILPRLSLNPGALTACVRIACVGKPVIMEGSDSLL